MSNKKEIENRADLEKLVGEFYTKVLQDPDLAPFFAHFDLKAHFPRMVDFWAFLLLDQPGFQRNVIEKHLGMPIEPKHFERWMHYFHETLDELFEGDKVVLAKQKAAVVRWTMESKLK